MICPKHIDGYLKVLTEENNYTDILVDDFTFRYQVECKCGNNEFHVLMNDSPIVKAECTSCGKLITVYDLVYYPAASIYKRYEELTKLIINGYDKFQVNVVYEYSDEFSIDDEDFDENDITWCHVFALNSVEKIAHKILNDETA